MATITVLSQKGGTGKTTTVRTLIDVFQRLGLSVLAVDLDPQGNLLGLAETELSLAGKIGRELALKRALREVNGEFDLVLIDCPPALGLLTVNALVASDFALLSAEAQYFALQGVEQALEVIELARETLNPDLQWLGVLLNIADMRTRHSREAQESLRAHYRERLFDTTIRASIAYSESAERAVSILDYRPDLGADYLALADEILERLRMESARERLAPLLSDTRAPA
jgi:chromosome partitioning protein